MILKNLEGVASLNIRHDWHADRKPGLSAMVRLKNEATWCAAALESILSWCDEIVIVLQPCDDDTPEIVQRYRGEAVRIYEYPVDTHPSGPGHDGCPADSVRASAWHYNWSLSKTTRSHVLKWDGDMIAMDWLGPELRSLMSVGHDRIKMVGTDIVGAELRHTGSCARCPTDGVFKVTPDVHYAQGAMTQRLACGTPATKTIEDAFLHFKWSKPLESAIKRWPADWRTKPHFRRIYQRREPVAAYTGEYPASVRAML